MKVIIVFILLGWSAFSQGQVLTSIQIIELFDEINKSDASNLNEPEIREQIFLQNFDTIIWIVQNQGFPSLSEDGYKKKNIQSINSGARRTFIHILQTQPELLLNEKMIALFKLEIDEGRLDHELLKIAMQTFQYDKDVAKKPILIWSKEVEDNFYLAFREWNIKLYVD